MVESENKEEFNTCLPNFLVLGGMKCGSTALHHNLNQHHQVYCPDEETKQRVINDSEFSISDFKGGLSRPDNKEIDFFNVNYEKGIKFYEKLFDVDKPFRGEVSPNYFYNPEGLASRIKFSLGNIKLIISLRDPLKRAYSHWNHIQNQNPFWGEKYYNISFEDALKVNDEENKLIKRSTYFHRIKKWEEYFTPNNIYVLLQESMLANPLEEHNKIMEFLGGEPFSNDVTFGIHHKRIYSEEFNNSYYDNFSNIFKNDVNSLKNEYPNLDWNLWGNY
jgi:hypothetical protein